MVWLQSWHSGFVSTAQQTGALDDATLQNMLGTLEHRAMVVIIVIAVVTAVVLVLGVVAAMYLGRLIGRPLEAAASGITSSSAELLSVASQVAASTAETAAATNETPWTVEEVKQTAILAQGKAAQASELSQVIAGTFQNGQLSAQRNQAHFDQIQSEMDAAAQAIDQLGEQVQAVAEVMNTVNDLAEQSNLLSVNASIEAAKSGEAGKALAWWPKRSRAWPSNPSRR